MQIVMGNASSWILSKLSPTLTLLCLMVYANANVCSGITQWRCFKIWKWVVWLWSLILSSRSIIIILTVDVRGWGWINWRSSIFLLRSCIEGKGQPDVTYIHNVDCWLKASAKRISSMKLLNYLGKWIARVLKLLLTSNTFSLFCWSNFCVTHALL